MTKVKVKSTPTIKEFPGLGAKIKRAREADERTWVQICQDAGISRTYWNQLENENLLAPVTEEIIRKIEATLNIDLGVNFD